MGKLRIARLKVMLSMLAADPTLCEVFSMSKLKQTRLKVMWGILEVDPTIREPLKVYVN